MRPASAQAWLLGRPASAPSSSWAWLPGSGGRRVVGQEEALGGAAPHGVVRVEEQAREAVCEVLDKAVGDLAERLPDLTRELPVVVLLQGESRAWLSGSGDQAFPGARPTPAPDAPCSSWRGAGLALKSPYRTGTFADLWAGKSGLSGPHWAPHPVPPLVPRLYLSAAAL